MIEGAIHFHSKGSSNMAAKTILIADDEPHLVHILSYNLEKAGLIVEIAVNGLECVEKALVLSPDLIVSDYQMPLLDGLQAATQLRADPRTAHIPVLILTARGHRIEPGELVHTHIRAVLPKPFSARQLLAKIEEILGAPDAGANAA